MSLSTELLAESDVGWGRGLQIVVISLRIFALWSRGDARFETCPVLQRVLSINEEVSWVLSSENPAKTTNLTYKREWSIVKLESKTMTGKFRRVRMICVGAIIFTTSTRPIYPHALLLT